MTFLPARMARLLVGGHQAHLQAAIDTLHREGALHIEDYQDASGLTTIGTPLPAGAAASEHLVKARGLAKALGSEGTPAGPAEADPKAALLAAEKAIAPVLETASKQRSDLAALESEQAALAPYRSLDIDLAALSGLKSVKIFLGQARSDPAPALSAAGLAFESGTAPAGSGVALAAVVAAKDAAAADKVLATVGFTAAALPAGRFGTPAARLAAIDAEKGRLATSIAASTADLASLRAAWGPRLAAAEATFTSEVEQTQAPLRFGVTQTTFHIEGWVPRSSANRVKNALAARFGDNLYVEDLGDAPRLPEKAAGQGHGHAAHAPDAHGAKDGPDHGHGAGHHDHAHHVEAKDEAPIHLENKGLARPYEFMLGLLGKPRYNEVDPTKLMLLFFPLFFGLMVGDVLVGLIIAGVGTWLKTNKVFGIGGPAVGRALLMGGLAAALVGGVVFGEALGIHFVTGDPHEEGEEKEISWEEILGLHLPSEGFVHKTGAATHVEALHATAATTDTATATDGHAVTTLAQGNATDAHNATATEESGGGFLGLLKPHSETHLVVGGMTFGFYSKVHDIQALLVWSVLIGVVHLNLGFFLGIRNVAKAHGVTLAIQEKAAWVFLQLGAAYAILGSLNHWPLAVPLGGAVVVGSIALLWMGAQKVLGAGFIAILEVFGLFGNLLSYTRLAAIGASKAGMVIAFASIGFTTIGGGDVHSVAGWAVFLLGMMLVIVLAILSGALQSLRLQFVEFFGKFFTGGGRPYVPFGRRAP